MAQVGAYIAANWGSILANAAIGAATSYAAYALQDDVNIANQGARLDKTRVVTSVEGSPIATAYGRVRIAGQLIWQTSFREESVTDRQDVGGKGGPSQTVENTTYLYYCSFAIGLCESNGSARLGRIWADGRLINKSAVNVRFYGGGEDQTADPKILAVEGANHAPAYRGLAYIVFDEMLLEDYGNRIPQITVEVINSLRGDESNDSLQDKIESVVLGPGVGEFIYHDEVVTRTGVVSSARRKNLLFDDRSVWEQYMDPKYRTVGEKRSNLHFRVSDQFAGKSVAVNDDSGDGVSNFINSLDNLENSIPNIGSVSLPVCWFMDGTNTSNPVKPKVEVASAATDVASYHVSYARRDELSVLSHLDQGTPCDHSVRNAFKELKSRGWRVCFSPEILFDTENFDRIDSLNGDVATFFGSAEPGEFTVAPVRSYSVQNGSITEHFDVTLSETVRFDNIGVWNYRRMVLHYAHLIKDILTIGDIFYVGSGMYSISNDPAFATHMSDLIADVKSILPIGVNVSYVADWKEYRRSNLTSVWNAGDLVAINYFPPLTDLREGQDYDIEAMNSAVMSGEYYDWYYANQSDRDAQIQTPITPDLKYKDVQIWTLDNHAPKPLIFAKTGCPTLDKASNEPDSVYDARQSIPQIPHYSEGKEDSLIQKLYLLALINRWSGFTGGGTPLDVANQIGLVSPHNIFVTTWDVRPYPFFPNKIDKWSDGVNFYFGNWLTNRVELDHVDDIIESICSQSGLSSDDVDTSKLVNKLPNAYGFSFANNPSRVAVIENILRTFQLQIAESEGRVTFTKKSESESFFVNAEDFLVEDPRDSSFLETRIDDADLPKKFTVEFVDQNANFEVAAVTATRGNTTSNAHNKFSSLFSFVNNALPENLAKILLQESWLGRTTIEFALPLTYKDIKVGNVITLDKGYQITRLVFGDCIEVRAVTYSTEIYDESAISVFANEFPDRRWDITDDNFEIGESTIVIADIPINVSDERNPWSPRILGVQDPWPGGIVIYSEDGSGGYTFNSSIADETVIGRTISPFGRGKTGVWDNVNSLQIRPYLDRHRLYSATEKSVLNGANVLALLTPDDEWEIIQFVNAQLESDGSYTLSRLLRGQNGTEAYMVDELPTDSLFFLVKASSMSSLSGSTELIGSPQTLRYGPRGIGLSDARFTNVEILPTGRSYRPYAPVHLKQDKLDNGDIRLRWTRRSRMLNDSWQGTTVPLNEAFEQYYLQIERNEPASPDYALELISATREIYQFDSPDRFLDPDYLPDHRTVVIEDQTFYIYTLAQQIEDHGAGVDSVNWKISQISAIYGHGSEASYTS